MTEQMGFERNKRLSKEYNNQRVTDTIGGQTCHFRSKLEHKWAKYLQFLKQNGHILDWQYESHRFIFKNVETAPVGYTPDFLVFQKDGTAVWQECKGHLEGRDATKFQRMAEQYPQDEIELVMIRMPKKDNNESRRLDRIKRKGWVRRVIDASAIFRQCGAII
jgi:hypothetical protein